MLYTSTPFQNSIGSFRHSGIYPSIQPWPSAYPENLGLALDCGQSKIARGRRLPRTPIISSIARISPFHSVHGGPGGTFGFCGAHDTVVHHHCRCCDLSRHADTIPKLHTTRNRNAPADIKRPNVKSHPTQNVSLFNQSSNRNVQVRRCDSSQSLPRSSVSPCGSLIYQGLLHLVGAGNMRLPFVKAPC